MPAGPTTSMRRRWATCGLVGLATLLVALPGVWARSTYGAQVSVDEPQYLMTALSLGHEFDLDVSDEIADGSFRSFHEPDLNTQTRPVDDRGRRFSPHDPLLPLLLAPAMLAAPDGPVAGPADDAGVRGWVAARLTLAAIAAITAALTAWVAESVLRVRRSVAAIVTILAFAGIPLGPYATQVYPEMPAALATMIGVAALSDRRTTGHQLTSARIWLATAAIVALPWLAVKYVPVAGVLAIWLLARTGHRQRLDTARVVVTLAAAAVVYAVVHQRIYGGWTVYAAGDHFVDTGELSVVGTDPDYVGRSRRLVGLLADASFGLVPWQPLWLLAPAALAAAARSERALRPMLAVFGTGYLVATFVALTMHGWWSPGRQVVVVMPIAVLAVARLVDRCRVLLWPAVLLGTAGAINWLWLGLESTTGRRTVIVDFTETGALPYRLLAPLFPDGLSDERAWLLPVWAVIFVGIAAAGWRQSSASGGAEGELPLDLAPQAGGQPDLGDPAEQRASTTGVG